jgi:hypothetical protein
MRRGAYSRSRGRSIAFGTDVEEYGTNFARRGCLKPKRNSHFRKIPTPKFDWGVVVLGVGNFSAITSAGDDGTRDPSAAACLRAG